MRSSKRNRSENKLVRACEQLLESARTLEDVCPDECEEIKKAGQHVGLALQYLSQLLSDQEQMALAVIGAENSDSAVDRMADRQLSRMSPEDEEPTAPPFGPSNPVASAMPSSGMRFRAPGAGPTKAKKLEGNSSTISISDLVSWFSLQGRDGVLRIEIPDEVITIVFEKGLLVEAVSNNTPQGSRLGEILVEQGALGSETLDCYLRQVEASGLKFGTRLAEQQVISEAALREALKAQIGRILGRAFDAELATFVLTEGCPADVGGRVSMNVMELLLEGARIRDEADAQ